MVSSITIRELELIRHQTNKYVIQSIYFPRKFKDDIKNITAKIAPREIYLINKLKIKMLVEINIIKSKEIDILAFRFITFISSYKIDVSIELKFKGRAIR